MSNTQEQVRAAGAGATAVSNRDVVRLSVNLASDVAGALKALSTSQGISVTEGVRRAIALWKLVTEELGKGNRIMVVEGEGDDAKFRELILL